jgi:hypothetical protein
MNDVDFDLISGVDMYLLDVGAKISVAKVEVRDVKMPQPLGR